MIDLKALAGRRWRTSLDGPASVPGQSEADRAWLVTVPAKHGHVGIHSADRLSVYCRSNRLLSRPSAVPGLAVRRRGDREFSATFPPERLDEVAGIIRAKRRRRVSEAERARIIRATAAHRFRARTTGTLPGP